MKKPIEVVAAILCLNDQKVLVGKRRAGDSNGGKWEFPGGKVFPKENPEDALKREIKEELGIDIEHFSFFDQILYHYEKYSVNIRFYLVPLTQEPKLELFSHDQLEWIHPKENTQFDFLEANKAVFEKLALLFGHRL